MEKTGHPTIVSGMKAALNYPLAFDPGSRWDYGIGIDWLGQAVEAVDGRRIDAFVTEEILQPLGMTSSGFECEGAMAARLADAGHEVLATDASAEMVRLAGRHPGVKARQATFDDLGALPPASLDGVWANFSLLHAPRDRFDAHLADIATALRPGGLFHIGMKTGKDSARDALGRSYTYYSAVDLTARLDAQGFEILEQSQGAEAGLAGAVEPWITLLTRKTDG